MENNITVIGLVVIFLLVIVLIMQIQVSTLSKKMEETEEIISKKMDALLKEKKDAKITEQTISDSSHLSNSNHQF